MRFRVFARAACCWPILWTQQAPGGQATGAGTLAVTVIPQCSLATVSQSSAPAGGAADGVSAITFTYKIRTGASAGRGEIVMRLTPAGESYPDGATVDYQAQLGGPGTARSGSVSMASALISGIVIGTFGAQASSSRAGASGTVEIKVNAASGSAAQAPRASLVISCQ